MIRITVIMAVLVLLSLLLTACLPDVAEPPFGVWMSDEPRIILYITPEYRVPVGPIIYLGLYTQDDIEVMLAVHFGAGRRFSLLDLTETGQGGGVGGGSIEGIRHSGMFLSGAYRVVGEEIRYTPWPHFQEKFGVSTISFRRVEDYDPIDPYYWLPELFPREED